MGQVDGDLKVIKSPNWFLQAELTVGIRKPQKLWEQVHELRLSDRKEQSRCIIRKPKLKMESRWWVNPS